jgi:hypothetical protein
MIRYLAILFVFSAVVCAQPSGPVLAVYIASPPTLTNGLQTPLLTDNMGNLKVTVAGGSISGNPAAGPTGSAVPADADYCGINVGGTLRGCTGVNPSGVVYAQQIDIASVNGSTVLVGNGTAAGALRVALPSDGTGQVRTLPQNGCGTTQYEQAFTYLPNSSTQLTATDTCVNFVWFSNHDTTASHLVTLQDQSTGCNSGVCLVYNTFTLPPSGVEARPLFGSKFTGGIKWAADAVNVVVGKVIGNQ